VRFTTPFLDSLIPESPDKLSPWSSKNFYFYEIKLERGTLLIQLAVYCRNLSPEMRAALDHLSTVLNSGELPKGYAIFFKSSLIKNGDNDTTESVMTQLDSLFEEVKAFEANISSKWNA
jgi:hypothetical protein